MNGLPRFKTKMYDVTVNEGTKNIEFKVEVGGCPKPSVHWYIGDMEITEKKKDYVRTEEGNFVKLIMSEVKAEMKGTYTCKLKNEFGEVKSSSMLIVNTRPKLLKKLVDQRINEGDTLKLIFEVSGTPDPEVKWYKDGKEVSTDARIKITRDSKRQENYDLTVTLVKGSDAGIYEVRAENELGYVTSKSKVMILSKNPNSFSYSINKIGFDCCAAPSFLFFIQEKDLKRRSGSSILLTLEFSRINRIDGAAHQTPRVPLYNFHF